jgi:hypothetical protein
MQRSVVGLDLALRYFMETQIVHSLDLFRATLFCFQLALHLARRQPTRATERPQGWGDDPPGIGICRLEPCSTTEYARVARRARGSYYARYRFGFLEFLAIVGKGIGRPV